MKIVIFGASGATGHELVKQALGLGHVVSAFVRSPRKLRITDGRLKIVQGDVQDFEAVRDAIESQDAVLVALGAKTPFIRDSSLVEGIRNIVRAMERKNVRRLIYLSFAGVHGCRKNLALAFRYLVLPLLGNLVYDHEQKEHLIRQSTLMWTIVRPALLTNGPHTGKFSTGEHFKPPFGKLPIARADVADFMLRVLTDRAAAGTAHFIASS